jgi:hypothetical protein
LLPIVLPPTLPGNFLEVSEFQEISRNGGFSCLPVCLFSKGNSIMTPLSVADGARLLGIHPKTLCHWLKQANLPLAAHPADARIKCVTQKDLQQVAKPSMAAHFSLLFWGMQPLLLLSSLKCQLALGVKRKENQLWKLVRSPFPTRMQRTRSKDWLP